MCKHLALAGVGVIFVALGVSSVWYSVLNAISNHIVTQWFMLFVYALLVFGGVGMAVYYAHYDCDEHWFSMKSKGRKR
ncbi:MAG: hypothetical protein ACHQX1_01785 [Candidatus Micrarchaeales archaeon]